MYIPRVIRVLILMFSLAAVMAVPASMSATTYERDIVYGHKYGMALTLDVMQPDHSNGCAILMLLSGGWVSGDGPTGASWYQSYQDSGYTIFAVRHGSQPKFTIPEIITDINRAVRYVRHNAGRWSIDPQRIGISGGSAGGHLSLMIATCGGPGDPEAQDPVDRESSAVQAVGCFYPPTDFLNYGGPGKDGIGAGPMWHYRAAFGPAIAEPEAREGFGRKISPIYHITAAMPPVLIIHGDADATVPLQQSETFVQRATEIGVTVRLVVKAGEGHGWKDKSQEERQIIGWFDQYLREAAR